MPNNENTLTVAFLNVLRPMRHSWNVAAAPYSAVPRNQIDGGKNRGAHGNPVGAGTNRAKNSDKRKKRYAS